MSRSGYSDDCSGWDLICWRGAVTSAIRGRRGQAFLREMLAALDALPEKKLIADELEAEGSFCAIGSVGAARGLDMAGLDPHDRGKVASVFGIPPSLAAEIMFENDADFAIRDETPEGRFVRVRQWVEGLLIEWDAEDSASKANT